MALPTGLVPVLAFVLTVGISVPVALASELLHRSGGGSFRSALRLALAGTGLLYLAGVVVIWAVAGGIELWEVPATLLLTGLSAFVVLTLLPLLVGRTLVRRAGAADSETALRYATYGWPVAMLAVFGVFLAPGGLARGDLLSLGGERICLAGHCGIAVPLAGALLLETALAVLGPGLVGLAIDSATNASDGTRTNPES